MQEEALAPSHKMTRDADHPIPPEILNDLSDGVYDRYLAQMSVDDEYYRRLNEMIDAMCVETSEAERPGWLSVWTRLFHWGRT